MAIDLPFTPQAFFELFAIYNRTLWPIVAAIWLVTMAAVFAAQRDPARHSRSLTALLAALWAWNAAVYQAWLFTRINPAAWLFAGLFAIEAVLLATAAREGLTFFSRDGLAPRTGVLLVIYAFAYPLLTVASGHPYPAAPTFAVPCPTTILTIGLFLTVRALPWRLVIVPAFWSGVGGAAAMLLEVKPDYALLGAGVSLVTMSVRRYLPRTMRSSPE